MKKIFKALLEEKSSSRQLVTIHKSTEVDLSEILHHFVSVFPEENIVLSDSIISQTLNIKPLRVARELLGSRVTSVLLDFRCGFPLDLFLCVANAVSEGGILVIVLDLEFAKNSESSRFHTEMIDTPVFDRYLLEGLKRFSLFVREDQLQFYGKEFISKIKETPLDNRESSSIIKDFEAQQTGVFTLFAPRGTGKSWIGSELILRNKGRYYLTAPNQLAISTYLQKKVHFEFKAPDALFLMLSEKIEREEILIIEEAAKIPLGHLERLTKRFKKVLMISSVENYEGTGQGLREKIFELIPIVKNYSLTHVRRFNVQDNLARFCRYLQLIDKEEIKYPFPILNANEIQYRIFDNKNLKEFRSNLRLLQSFYHLLNHTHYQTNIQDLRRLMDIDKQVFVIAEKEGMLIGALWGIEEGEMNSQLAQDVFYGLRRPKGNLGAQTLSAHSYYPEAMQLSSIRISRISVDKQFRINGIARKMLDLLKTHYRNEIDYLSVSYGVTRELLVFWEKCGFTWIHLGSHQDKTTGLHSALMIYPFSQNGKTLNSSAKQKFGNDAYFWQRAPFIRQETQLLLRRYALSGNYDERDEDVIRAYSEFNKSKISVYPALERQKQKA